MEEAVLINIKQVAKLLNVKENTIRVWISMGKVIPSELIIKLGRRTLINRIEFLEWVKNGCKQKVNTKTGKEGI